MKIYLLVFSLFMVNGSAFAAGNPSTPSDTQGEIPDKNTAALCGITTMQTVAGTGESGFSGDGGAATEAQLSPGGLAFDFQGNLYIADEGDNRVRKVDTQGVISTVAGMGDSGFSGDGGPALQAKLSGPTELTIDSQGNLYILDSLNQRVRKVNGRGIISTIAGTGEPGFSGDGGPATQAKVTPKDIAVDSQGNLLILDFSHYRIRKVDSQGIISTFAGTGEGKYFGDGGPATQANLQMPFSLAFDAEDNLYFTDYTRVRRVNTQGVISTVAGTGEIGYSDDGIPATQAKLGYYSKIAFDTQGNYYLTVMEYRILRWVDGQGIIHTFGLTTRSPYDLAIDSQGNLYFSDITTSTVVKFKLCATQEGVLENLQEDQWKEKRPFVHPSEPVQQKVKSPAGSSAMPRWIR